MDRKLTDVMRHTRAQIDENKRELQMYYAELKLKLPTYLKSLTIGELKAAGATIDPNIFIPKEADNRLRTNADVYKKKALILEKLEEIVISEKVQIINYYRMIKNQIPKELLKKKMCHVNEDQWLALGIDRSKLIDSNFKKN